LKKEKPRVLQSYVDANYAGDLEQQRSTKGYVFTVAECVISWKVELQDIIALSTTEVEYIATVEASKEALWLRGLIETFSIIQDSVRVHCDSQSVIHLAKDHTYHKEKSRNSALILKMMWNGRNFKVCGGDVMDLGKNKN